MNARTVTSQAELESILERERRPHLRLEEGTFTLPTGNGDPRRSRPRITLERSARLDLSCDAAVTAKDQSFVRSCGTATIELEGDAVAVVTGTETVYADGNSTVVVDGDVTVNASGTAIVHASAARVVYVGGNATATVRTGVDVVADRDDAVGPFDERAFLETIESFDRGCGRAEPGQGR